MKLGPTALRDPRCLLGLGFGSGLLRPAPGTWGTLAALPFAVLLGQLPITLSWALVAAAAVVGVHLCDYTAKALGVHDHPAIVWDEFVGVWITLLFAPMTWVNVLLGFALFRLFDIIKPWPIRWLDRQVDGGLGIMVDDVVAGLFAGLVLALIVGSGLLPSL